jgi:hypothetical protein
VPPRKLLVLGQFRLHLVELVLANQRRDVGDRQPRLRGRRSGAFPMVAHWTQRRPAEPGAPHAAAPVYEEAIAPAATQAGLECHRADEIMKPGAIMAQVWQSLMESRVVVADLTNMNPNVFYELGLAHAIGHDVILLTQDKKWVPFDLQHMRWFKYQPDTHGLHLLRQKLRTAFKEVLGETALGGVKA